MKIAICKCGFKLLVVPDLAAMKKAIKNHLSKHNCDEEGLTKEILIAVANRAKVNGCIWGGC